MGPISRFDVLRVDDRGAMIDINLGGTLHGIAAALPVFGRRRSAHVVNIVSTAGLKILPTMRVYAATKNAVPTAPETLRQEAGPYLRVTEISPGYVATGFADPITDPAVRSRIEQRMADFPISPEAAARAAAYVVEQPPHVEIGSIVIPSTAQD